MTVGHCQAFLLLCWNWQVATGDSRTLCACSGWVGTCRWQLVTAEHCQAFLLLGWNWQVATGDSRTLSGVLIAVLELAVGNW